VADVIDDVIGGGDVTAFAFHVAGISASFDLFASELFFLFVQGFSELFLGIGGL
jgi:hypothetical protein